MGAYYEETLPGIVRISLPHPAGLATNAYLLMGSEPCLVDPGHPGKAARDCLDRALAAYGLTFGNIAWVLFTALHPDRLGPAAGHASCRVVAPANQTQALHDLRTLSAIHVEALLSPILDDTALGRLFDPKSIEQIEAALSIEGHLRADVLVQPPARFHIGQRVVSALALGGPSASHLGYWIEPDGVLLTGELTLAFDHELPLLLTPMGGSYHNLMQSALTVASFGSVPLLSLYGGQMASADVAMDGLLRVAQQTRENVRALVLGAPRSFATLLQMLGLGRPCSPWRLLLRSHTLRAIVQDLARVGDLEIVRDGSALACRLSARAMRSARQLSP